MNTLPKPKYCQENWLAMDPAERGRICKQCKKLIVDFTKMDWPAIAAAQQLNNNSLCGVYTNKQLKHWGKTVPSNNIVNKYLSITGLTLSLSTPIFSQNINKSDSIVIKGRIVDTITLSEIPMATLILKEKNITTTCDYLGQFTMVVYNISQEAMPDTLEVFVDFYTPKKIYFSDIKELANTDLYISLQENLSNIKDDKLSLDGVTFYVSKPTFYQKITWNLKRLFKKNSKY